METMVSRRSMLVAAALVAASLPAWRFAPATARAEEPAQESYVVLGDSISTGYGLDEEAGEASFASLLAEEYSFALKLLAKDGQTAVELAEQLEDPEVLEDIAGADLITITIGGNDFMQALYTYLANAYNEAASAGTLASAGAPTSASALAAAGALAAVGGQAAAGGQAAGATTAADAKAAADKQAVGTATAAGAKAAAGATTTAGATATADEQDAAAALDAEDVAQALRSGDSAILSFALGAVSGFAASREAFGALTQFGACFPKVLEAIKTANPDAKVIVSTQYNPYAHLGSAAAALGLDGLATAFEDGLDVLNQAIVAACKQYDCAVADVYAKFQKVEENPCNASVSFAGANLDFHPNAYGHAVIAEVFSAVISGIDPDELEDDAPEADAASGDAKVAAPTAASATAGSAAEAPAK